MTAAKIIGSDRTNWDGLAFVLGVTTEPIITASTTTFIPALSPRHYDYPVVPERLLRIDGVDYVRCPTHGLIPLEHHCAKAAGDHWCRAAAHPSYDPSTGEHGLDDQGSSHEDWSNVQSDKLHYIASLHVQDVDDHGGVSGFCGECDNAWPCRTVHMANGWGEIHDCEDQGWCSHAGSPLPVPDDRR